MINRRFAGAVLLAGLAGCSVSQPQPANSSSPLSKASTKPAIEEPKWEASSTPQPNVEDMLAKKTADYARRLQQANAAELPATQASTEDGTSKALFSGSNHHKHATPPPADAAPSEAPPQPALAGNRQTPNSTAAPAPAPDGPKIMPESADFISAGSNDPLAVRLRKRTRDNPRDIASQLDLQLYGMLNDDPSPELATVTQLPAEDQELVSALLDGLSNFRSAVREDSNMLQAKKIQPLLEMADRLRSQADLTVSNVTLCKSVNGYGKYEPISPLRFPAGRENAAIVYCEVENFLPKQIAGVWQTKLSEQVTVYTDAGMLAWSDEKREVVDECKNRRHDFFAYNIIKMPASIPMGRYRLTVSIEDQNAGRVAEATVPFTVAAK